MARIANHPARRRIALSVHGTIRQEGDLADPIWPLPEMIAALSGPIAGAWIYHVTRTPERVGPAAHGHRLAGEVAGAGGAHTRIQKTGPS
jgi:fumarylpyruvate hydrolase